jgi:hypothetical protein
VGVLSEGLQGAKEVADLLYQCEKVEEAIGRQEQWQTRHPGVLIKIYQINLFFYIFSYIIL